MAHASPRATGTPRSAGLWRLAGLLAFLAVALSAQTAAADDELYKWVDEEGNVTYQDRPPPGKTDDAEMLERSEENARSSGASDVDVVLYSSGNCPECDAVRQLLLSRGVPFEEKLVDGNPALEAKLRERAGVLSLPTLAVGDNVLLGHNEDLILAALEEAGFPGMLLDRPAGGTAATPRSDKQKLTREQLEQMTPEEIEQAARDAALRGEDNDLFEEDEGFLTLNEDIFPDAGPSGAPGEEINDLEGSEGERGRTLEP